MIRRGFSESGIASIRRAVSMPSMPGMRQSRKATA